jgi:hypothetical protein
VGLGLGVSTSEKFQTFEFMCMMFRFSFFVFPFSFTQDGWCYSITLHMNASRLDAFSVNVKCTTTFRFRNDFQYTFLFFTYQWFRTTIVLFFGQSVVRRQGTSTSELLVPVANLFVRKPRRLAQHAVDHFV